MRTLPLLIATPDEPALLPFEWRRIDLVDEKMIATARLAARSGGGELVFQAHETASRQILSSRPDGESLLPVGTSARILGASFEEEHAFLILRGVERVEVETEEGETSFLPFPAEQGTEAAFRDARDRLASLDLLPVLRGDSLEAKIDRLAIWMALPAWVQGEVLSQKSLDKRLSRLLDHARELACPGSSFRPDDLRTPFTSDEDYFACRVSLYGARAKAVGGSVGGRRRRAAALRVRATSARLRQRIVVSEREGRLPALEKLIAAHQLPAEAVDALLVAGLGAHPRFGPTLESATRLLPPGELPLNVWITALEEGIFTQNPQ